MTVVSVHVYRIQPFNDACREINAAARTKITSFSDRAIATLAVNILAMIVNSTAERSEKNQK